MSTATLQLPRSNYEKVANAVAAVLAAAELKSVDALRVLRRVGETLPVAEADAGAAFEKARLRSLGVEDELRSLEGGGLSDAEFARRLGLTSRETVRNYRAKGRIFAWEKGARNLRYPAWQIHQRTLLPGLDQVLVILNERDLSPLALVNYFLSVSEELGGRRPLDLLREGRIEDVTTHARRYGQIGA